jgi:diacylglycerol kinase (ATP)
MKRLIRATQNSYRGLRVAFATQAAIREEIAALALAVPGAFLVTSLVWERLLLIGVVLLAIAIELLNTAIEGLADCITREPDERIGRFKDMGSAAVGSVSCSRLPVGPSPSREPWLGEDPAATESSGRHSFGTTQGTAEPSAHLLPQLRPLQKRCHSRRGEPLRAR